jgi:hypothetical protein
MRFFEVVRSEGLEPPRFYSLPPQGSASTNSATSAWKTGAGFAPHRIDGADVTNQRCRDKACRRGVFDAGNPGAGLPGAGQPRQHLLDFDRDTVAIDKHHTAGDRQIVGKYLDFVRLGGVQFYDGATAEAHDLMNRHRSGPEDHHKIDGDFIEGWHWGSDPYLQLQNCCFQINTLWLANG